MNGVLYISAVQKQLLHNIGVGDRNFDIRQFFLCKETKVFGFAADPHLRLLRKIIAVYHDHHPPDAAIPEGRNPSRIVIHRQFFKLILVDPDPQFLIGSTLFNIRLSSPGFVAIMKSMRSRPFAD